MFVPDDAGIPLEPRVANLGSWIPMSLTGMTGLQHFINKDERRML